MDHKRSTACKTRNPGPGFQSSAQFWRVLQTITAMLQIWAHGSSNNLKPGIRARVWRLRAFRRPTKTTMWMDMMMLLRTNLTRMYTRCGCAEGHND